MEEIIQEALSKGVQMHVSGNFELAGELYASVLKLHPKHADANHNMGLLKIDTGHDLDALPYLQTALQADTSIAQFWLSYINALITLGRVDEASRILDLAAESGFEEQEFRDLHNRLKKPSEHEAVVEKQATASTQSLPNILDNLRLDQALKLANQNIQEGSPNKARHIYQDILKKFPKNVKAQKGLASVNKPPQNVVNKLINLYNQGQLEATIENAKAILKEYPNAFEVWNILGVTSVNTANLKQAIAAFREVIALNPNYAEAYNNLGVVLQEEGKLEEAVASYNSAISLKADYAEALNNKGNTLKLLGRLQEAIDTFNEAILLKPDYAEAYYNMGNALKDQDKLKAATEAYAKALSINSNIPQAYYNMGNALKDQDKLEEAIEAYNYAISLDPSYADAYNNLGLTLGYLGKPNEAVEAYTMAISLQPNIAEVHYNFGVVLTDQEKLNEAIDAYNTAISLKPDYPEAFNKLGTIFKKQGNLDKALQAFKSAIELKVGYVSALNNLGNLFKDQGKFDHALEAYNKALLFKPDSAGIYYNLGNMHNDQGKLIEALKAYKKALKIKPDYAAAHRSLSALVHYKSNDPQISTVTAILQQPSLPDSDRCQLYYTYAKMNEDLGDFNQAFKSYIAGGEIRKKQLAYDLRQDKLLFEQIKKNAGRIELLKEPLYGTTDQVKPIFIIGMPRSGTTLVEQIISCHSEVQDGGELSEFERFGGSISIGNEAAELKKIIQVRKNYLKKLKQISNGKSYVTDKMPQNFIHLSLIIKALPEAKIIHVKRDPAATCWSNFKHYFAKEGLGYSYNLTDTASYFKMYQNLMQFWKQLYSGQIYHLDYDKLTNEQVSETKMLIAHLGLPWETSCLSPQSNNRNVKTTSQHQVRKRIYQGSSKAWRNYEPFLDNAFDDLYL